MIFVRAARSWSSSASVKVAVALLQRGADGTDRSRAARVRGVRYRRTRRASAGSGLRTMRPASSIRVAVFDDGGGGGAQPAGDLTRSKPILLPQHAEHDVLRAVVDAFFVIRPRTRSTRASAAARSPSARCHARSGTTGAWWTWRRS